MNDHLPACCTDMEIDLLDLLFPGRMSPEGQEFVEAHGLELATLRQLQRNATYISDTRVKLYHKCQQLTRAGRCRIYEHRPQLCRAFDCALRHDCACQGKGIIKLYE